MNRNFREEYAWLLKGLEPYCDDVGDDEEEGCYAVGCLWHSTEGDLTHAVIVEGPPEICQISLNQAISEGLVPREHAIMALARHAPEGWVKLKPL